MMVVLILILILVHTATVATSMASPINLCYMYSSDYVPDPSTAIINTPFTGPSTFPDPIITAATSPTTSPVPTSAYDPTVYV
mmetsp:Transcript_50738/g.56663  ORF Transcript_50738/g.56663 Transcript_50738/m.56663 type:complete len:82 (+) Transcript_50738:375-620(+)